MVTRQVEQAGIPLYLPDYVRIKREAATWFTTEVIR